MKRIGLIVCSGVSLATLAGCMPAPRLPQAAARLPAQSSPPNAAASDSGVQPSVMEVKNRGWRIDAPPSVAPSGSNAPVETRRSVSLAFDKAPIAVVTDAVLSDTLHRSYRIDPEIQGEITLRLTGKLTESEIVGLFDQALRSSGAALSDGPGGSYVVVAAQKAPALSRPPTLSSSRSAPYTGGVYVYTARFVSAAEMVRVLQPLAGESAQVRADGVREHVYLSGDVTTVNALIRAAEVFDVDWMRGRSFYFYPLRHGSPKAIVAEVNSVLGGKDGPIGTQVEFIEIDRLGAIIVAAKSPAMLDQVVGWLERLDQPSPGAARRMRVIPLSNLVAQDFTKVLSELLAGEAMKDAGAAGGPVARKVTADARSNSVIMFADDAEYQNVLDVVRALDVPPAQVMIEATLAEVTLNDQLRFGVQWFLDSGDFTAGFSSADNSSAAPSFPGFSARYLGTDFRAVLNALSTVTDVQLISTPRILVLANETASLQVGDQVPIITQTATGTQDDSRIVNTVQYRDTGVVLSVTPRIGDGGRMFIDIQQEVSEVAGTTSSDIDSPTIQQRRFATKVQVEDGQVIALGGLIRSSASVGDTGVPLLSRTPVLGALFRSRSNTSRQTELVVFLRPTLVRTRSEADRATEEITARMQALGMPREAR